MSRSTLARLAGVLSVSLLATTVFAAPTMSVPIAAAAVAPASKSVDFAAALGSDGTFTGAPGLTGTIDTDAWTLASSLVAGEPPRFQPVANTPAVTGEWSAVGLGADGALNNVVQTVAVSGSDLYVGGLFTDVAGLAKADYVAKWDGSNWSALGDNLNNGSGTNGALTSYVFALAVSGSDVYASGGFTDVAGLATADYVAKWDGSNWSALGDNLNNGSGTNGAINSYIYGSAASGSDVYVAGHFTNAAGLAKADYMAKWDGSTWSALGDNLNNGLGSNGAFNTHVYAIAVSGGDVYAGGNFTNAAGLAEADYLAKWDGSNWWALGDNLNNGSGTNGALGAYVSAFAVSGNDLYVGGQFVNAAGIAQADFVALWDGSVWSGLGDNLNNGTGANGAIIDGSGFALAVSGGVLYVGGPFTNVAGLAKADYVAMWDGSTWSALGDNLNDGSGTNGALDSYLFALAVSGSDLYVGGTFTNAAGLGAADSLARWSLTANNPPTSTDDSASTNEDTALVLGVTDFGTYADTESTPLALVRITALPLSGTLEFDTTGSGGWTPVALDQDISQTEISAGRLRFMPTANENGIPYTTIGFKVGDGADVSSIAYTLTINVDAVNSPPTSSDDTAAVEQDTTLALAVSDFGVYADTESTPLSSVRITTLPTSGSLEYDTTGVGAWAAVTSDQDVSAADITANRLRFSPAANAFGSPYATVGFKVSDGTDLSTSSFTLTINVSFVNHAPAGTNNTVTTAQDTDYTFTAADFGFSDATDSSGFMAVKVSSLPGAGTLRLNGSAVGLNGDVSTTDIASAKLTFSPAAGASGTPYTSFTFQVRDDDGTQGSGTDLDQSPNSMTIDVTPTPVTACNPDATIRIGSKPWRGLGLCNGDATGQAVSGTKAQGRWMTLYVSVTNRGDVADAVRYVAVGPSSAGQGIKYFHGSTNIKAAVVAGTYTSPSLLPGRSYQIRVRVRLTAAVGSPATRLITVTSVGDGDLHDTVRFTVALP